MNRRRKPESSSPSDLVSSTVGVNAWVVAPGYRRADRLYTAGEKLVEQMDLATGVAGMGTY